MTHLHSLNSLKEPGSTVELQEQGVQSIQAAPGKEIPKLSDFAFIVQLGEFNKLPLSQRVIVIQNTPMALDLKMRFLQPVIEQKLREANTYDALLALFQEIKTLCSLEAVYNPELFHFYMKPIIKKVAEEQNTQVSLQGFLAKTKAFSKDAALCEMFGLWYVYTIHNQEELSFIFQEPTFITKIKVTYQIGDAGAVALANSLKVNRTLTSLNLRSNQIGDAGARALGDSLKVNRTLTSLDLGSNQIRAAGARALGDSLKVNKTLTSLNLESNQIGAAGARALGDSLKENRTLTSLNLRSNQIGDAGAEALADSLKVNGTLTSLYLRYNQIGDAGAGALADSLRVNRTLTSLDLWYNQIGDAGAGVLGDSLRVNRTLTSLDLWNNQIGEDIKQVWREMGALYPERSFEI